MERKLALTIAFALAVCTVPGALADGEACTDSECPEESPPAGEGESDGNDGGNGTDPSASGNESAPSPDGSSGDDSESTQQNSTESQSASQDDALSDVREARSCTVVEHRPDGWRIDPDNCIQRIIDRLLGPPLRNLSSLL